MSYLKFRLRLVTETYTRNSDADKALDPDSDKELILRLGTKPQT